MNVVIYARYSSTSQRDASIEVQLEACHEFCKKNDMIVVEEYVVLFFKLFTASCCTLFTTIFKIISNATSHYSSPIRHIKYCYPKTKHII